MSYQYDLIVIGAGPGGYEAADFAAKLNKKVALVEKDKLGGTCLNRGCIPTKTLLHSSEMAHCLDNNEEFKITGSFDFNLEKMIERKNNVVKQLQDGIASMLKKNKVDVIYGEGILQDEHHVLINNETYSADNILIATGSAAIVPKIEGIENLSVMTSDELLNNTKQIQHLVIVGGGVIGCEFAALYASLGSKVTIIEMADSLLFNLDKEISQSLKLQFKKLSIDVLTKTALCKIETGNKLILKNNDKEITLECDQVLFAVGRRPYCDNLFSSSFELENEKGKIIVDDNFKTSVSSIYAIGDVIGKIQLAHVATAQGLNAVCHMFNQEAIYDLNIIPSCIYTHPEIAVVGYTLEDAKNKGINAQSFKVPTAANAKSFLSNQPRGFVKIVVDCDNDKVIGATLMGARATDMISLFTQAIVTNQSIYDLRKVIFPHPTFSESVKDCVHLACEKLEKKGNES